MDWSGCARLVREIRSLGENPAGASAEEVPQPPLDKGAAAVNGLSIDPPVENRGVDRLQRTYTYNRVSLRSEAPTLWRMYFFLHWFRQMFLCVYNLCQRRSPIENRI